MTVRKIKAGRIPTIESDEYVGELGTIFYSEDTGELRLSDGVTAGGIPVIANVAANLQSQIDSLRQSIDANTLSNLTQIVSTVQNIDLAALANVSALSSNVTVLTANAVSQQGQINSLLGNVIVLTANAVSQQGQINSLLANSTNLLSGNSISNGNSRVSVSTVNGNIVITANAGTARTWAFGTDSILTLPNGSKIGPIEYANGNSFYSTGQDGYSELNWNNTNYTWVDNEGTTVSIEGKNWTFDRTGNLTLAGDLYFPNNLLIEQDTALIQTSGQTYVVATDVNGNTTVTGRSVHLAARSFSSYLSLTTPRWTLVDNTGQIFELSGWSGTEDNLNLGLVPWGNPEVTIQFPVTIRSGDYRQGTHNTLTHTIDGNIFSIRGDGSIKFDDGTVQRTAFVGDRISTDNGNITLKVDKTVWSPRGLVQFPGKVTLTSTNAYDDQILKLSTNVQYSTFTIRADNATTGGNYKQSEIQLRTDGDVIITSYVNGVSNTLSLNTNGDLDFPGDLVYRRDENAFYSTGNIKLRNDLSTWNFAVGGNLTIPGTITGANLLLESNSIDISSVNSNLVSLETEYNDRVIMLQDAFDQVSGQPGYPWGITLPVSHLTYNQLINLAPGTVPVQLPPMAQQTYVAYNAWQEVLTATTVSINAGAQSWNFGADGNLTLPNSGYLVLSTGIRGTGASPAPLISGFSSGNFADSLRVNNLTMSSSNITVAANQTLNVNLSRTFPSAGSTTLKFNLNGVETNQNLFNITTAGGIFNFDGQSGFQQISFSNSSAYIKFGTSTRNNTGAANDIELWSYGGDNSAGNVFISAGSNPTSKRWTFNSYGQLRFPDASIQTTAWRGNIDTYNGYINFTASPAPGTSGITFADGTNQTTAWTQSAAKVQSTPPGSPVTGQFYYDTDDGRTYIYTGSAWVDSNPAGGGAGSGTTYEAFTTIANATGVVTHDATTSRLFYHTTPAGNFTANVTNLGLTTGQATSVTLVITQGATARSVTALQISGAAQTILWQGSATAPTGNASRTDVVTFSIMCTAANTFVTMGILTSFGGA